MENEVTISALLRKRKEIAAQIAQTEKDLYVLRSDLNTVEATARMFKPSIQFPVLRSLPIPRKHHAEKGDMMRLVLDTLREKGEPMSATDIAEVVMARRELDGSDRGLVLLMRSRVGACLRQRGKMGIVRPILGPGRTVTWEIAR
jgi:hypothetical protein